MQTPEPQQPQSRQRFYHLDVDPQSHSKKIHAVEARIHNTPQTSLRSFDDALLLFHSVADIFQDCAL